MKVAITTTAQDIDSPFEPRFGFAANFLIVDSRTGEWKAMSNPMSGAKKGAGLRAARLLVDEGVEAVISGEFGPNAFEVLSSAGVHMYKAAGGTARELLEDFTTGGLTIVNVPSRGGQFSRRGG